MAVSVMGVDFDTRFMRCADKVRERKGDFLMKSVRVTMVATLLLVLLVSCSKKPTAPPEPEPTTFYLCYNETLSLQPGPSDSWLYITNYIYPSPGANTSCSWETHLNKNIAGTTYEYDLVVWSASNTHLRMELILDHEGSQQTLFSKEFDIPYIDDTTGIGFKNEIEGTNPMAGEGGTLIIRITHIGGSDPIEIYYDAAVGSLGNASIVVPLL